MARQKSTGPKQQNARGADTDRGRDQGRNAGAGDTARDDRARRAGPEGGAEAEQPDWADEAARARTADDPRRVTPHDRAGVPSTGDRR